MRNDARRVLIVDDDLGIMFWLGWTLMSSGYKAYPAKSISSARKLLAKINPEIDLLLINPGLRGAAEFANSLREHRRRLRVVALAESDDPRLAKFSKVDGAFPKPSSDSDERLAQLLEGIQRMLVRHLTA